MAIRIHTETVTDLLWSQLKILMNLDSLKPFRLVGGTALSLMIGHRMYVDIDIFTDEDYGSVDFKAIYKDLKRNLGYVSNENWTNQSFGNSCFIGESKSDLVKLDLFYTDPFVYPIILHENVRISSVEEIIAMKLEVIGRGGRKKDFYDIHAVLDKYNLTQLLDIYEKRNPFTFSREQIKMGLIDFDSANQDPDPNCLYGNYWELIKLDFEELVIGDSSK